MLPQVLRQRTLPPVALTFSDIHSVTGTPASARAALAAAGRAESWGVVATSYHAVSSASRLSASNSDWSGYSRVCEAEGVSPLPVTVSKMLSWWCERVIGRRLKSSSLPTATSRVLSHASLLGQECASAKTIRLECERFCETFPCEVRSAAPTLGVTDGLDTATEFASSRAASSLFFRMMTALLLVSQALYCRPSALLEGRLRRSHVSYLPPCSSAQGGLVISLLLPKRRKNKVDRRLDSHPIPSGPAVLALLTLMDSLGLLQPDAPPDAIVFPDIDPVSDRVMARVLTVRRSTELLRQHVFVPAGILGGASLTLRSIRSGSSTDAAISGIPNEDRLAQGGWRSAAGAATYLDRCFALLSQPASLKSSGQQPP